MMAQNKPETLEGLIAVSILQAICCVMWLCWRQLYFLSAKHRHLAHGDIVNGEGENLNLWHIFPGYHNWQHCCSQYFWILKIPWSTWMRIVDVIALGQYYNISVSVSKTPWRLNKYMGAWFVAENQSVLTLTPICKCQGLWLFYNVITLWIHERWTNCIDNFCIQWSKLV